MPNDITIAMWAFPGQVGMMSRTAAEDAMREAPDTGGRAFEARAALRCPELDLERPVAG